MPHLFTHVSELVQPWVEEGDSRCPLDVTPNAALLVEDGRIVAAGPETEVAVPGVDRVDLGGRAIVPGLVDSHTHLVFAGERIDEMARRARGETYEQIARAGGGIVRSVEALRNASQEHLVRSAATRLAAMARRGTTTCEIKSGYGLEPALELAQLRAIAAVAAASPIDIFTTVLAHVIPATESGDRGGFVARFADEAIAPAAARGAHFLDVFVETGAYTTDEARTLCRRGRELGLGVKLHVDQLSDGGGAALAAELGALSADHLEHTSAAGMDALAAAGVVATVLPGCRLFLGSGPWPPARRLRDAGCPVAIATDCNPGSSMISDLPLCASVAATCCGLSLEEALWGVTRGGAKALGLVDRGTLRLGERADFLVIDHHDWRALLYRPADAPVARVFKGGVPVSA